MVNFDIYGTERFDMDIIIVSDCFSVGDNISTTVGTELTIFKKEVTGEAYYKYTVKQPLSEEDLEIALMHFKMLFDNKLVFKL